ncbi:DUF7521 family protein [Halocatena marina]|uniref:DUF7521 family protein n=1 Tax=Halocatena marina TaxID=2934937 RepID=UPI00200BA2F7|nr:hypothetical protein [Halocatena marina]
MVTESPKAGLFIGINIFVLLVGLILTALSYGAYRRTDKRELLFAVGGFLSITLGAIIEVFYEVGVKGSYNLFGDELLTVQSIESILIGIGLASLFYSLRQY